MINAKYLGYNELILFGTILEEKNDPGKSILRSITPRVFNSYDQYMNNFSELERKSTSEFTTGETRERSSLKLCYTSASETFKLIKGKIFNNQPNQLKAFCPYCLLDKPKTLDHYISKTEFPEYSILNKNLIPCCYDCNQKKGEVWRKGNRRRFIHYYNDTFLDHKFLHAKLIYSQGITVPRISYFLMKPREMKYGDFQTVRFHFKDLNLLDEYKTRANTCVSSEIDVMKEAISIGVTKNQIRNGLINKFNAKSRDFGINYWEALLYEALASNSKLINSL